MVTKSAKEKLKKSGCKIMTIKQAIKDKFEGKIIQNGNNN